MLSLRIESCSFVTTCVSSEGQKVPRVRQVGMATENSNLVMLANVVMSQQPINFAIQFFSVESFGKKKQSDEKGLKMQIKYWEMGIKIPFPATAEKSDVDTTSFAQSFMKQAAFKCQSLNANPSLSAS